MFHLCRQLVMPVISQLRETWGSSLVWLDCPNSLMSQLRRNKKRFHNCFISASPEDPSNVQLGMYFLLCSFQFLLIFNFILSQHKLQNNVSLLHQTCTFLLHPCWQKSSLRNKLQVWSFLLVFLHGKVSDFGDPAWLRFGLCSRFISQAAAWDWCLWHAGNMVCIIHSAWHGVWAFCLDDCERPVVSTLQLEQLHFPSCPCCPVFIISN